MIAFAILFLVYYIIYEPILGFLLYKKFTKNCLSDKQARLWYYKIALAGVWTPAFLIILLISSGKLALADVGLGMIKISFSTFGELITNIIMILAAILAILGVYQLAAVRISRKFREKLQSKVIPADIEKMLPVTGKEKRLWAFVSVSAGLTEELIYRGFLMYLLGFLFPGLHVFGYMAAAALLFGAAHSYQGWRGMLQTGIYGLFLTSLFICTGSLLPGMLLHFILDYAARDIKADPG